MIRAFFVSVAQGQTLQMEEFYWYLMGSDHMVETFSIYRTLRNAGTNLTPCKLRTSPLKVRGLKRFILVVLTSRGILAV